MLTSFDSSKNKIFSNGNNIYVKLEKLVNEQNEKKKIVAEEKIADEADSKKMNWYENIEKGLNMPYQQPTKKQKKETPIA